MRFADGWGGWAAFVCVPVWTLGVPFARLTEGATGRYYSTTRYPRMSTFITAAFPRLDKLLHTGTTVPLTGRNGTTVPLKAVLQYQQQPPTGILDHLTASKITSRRERFSLCARPLRASGFS